MNTVVRPVGPRPPRVYWVRRLVVVLAGVLALAVVWALALLAMRLFGGDDAAAAAPVP